jgi:dUTP pyrophosphatase
MSKLQVKLLSAAATVPTRGTPYAAGYDLSSAESCVVPARGRKLIKTDIAVAIPSGTYARVAPRSGLAFKHGIDVMAGVIDEDYRGAVGVILYNTSDEPFQISIGDRVAQLILEKIETPWVHVVEELDETNRGEGGFGSTGVRPVA